MDPWLIVLLLVVIVGVAAYLLTRKGPQLPVGDVSPAPLPAKPETPVAALPKAIPAEPAAIPLVAKVLPTEAPVTKAAESAPVTSPVGEVAPPITATAAETAPAPVAELLPAPAVEVSLVVGRAAHLEMCSSS